MDTEEAFAFAGRLRGDPSSISDPGWRDEPADAAWPIKRYDGGEKIALPGALPWWAPASSEPADDVLARLGHVLFDSVGISRVRWQPGGTVLSSPQRPGLVWPQARLSARRPVPSGGAMYPAEIYVALTGSGERSGIFHYDPARHELTDLAHDAPARALQAALRERPDAPLALVALILTHRFCKNLYKYGNFAYRLGAVDTGVVLGRLAARAQAAFGALDLRLDFDDVALNAACGLDGAGESAYAVLLLGAARQLPPAAAARTHSARARPVAIERGRPARPSAVFAAMHAAAMQRSASSSRAASMPALPVDSDPETTSSVALPPPDPQAGAARRAALCRTSNGDSFTGGALSAALLADVLGHTATAVAALRAACVQADPPSVELFCAVDRVHDVPVGWYRYDAGAHRLVAAGVAGALPPATALQQALYSATIDIERSAFSVHVVTGLDFRADPRGVRAYRVQQLFVGAAIEAATRISAAAGAGSHPLLGLDASRVDELYGLAGGPFGVQAHVSIGAARSAGWLEGSVIG